MEKSEFSGKSKSADSDYDLRHKSVLYAEDRTQIKRISATMEAANPSQWARLCPRRIISPPEYIRHEFQAIVASTSMDVLRQSISEFLQGKRKSPVGAKIDMAGGQGSAKKFNVNFDTDVSGNDRSALQSSAQGPLSSAVVSSRALALINGQAFEWPTYFMSAGLASALLMTEPPEDLRLDQLKWPLDFFSLFLPLTPELQALTCGRRVPFIWVSRSIPEHSMADVQLVSEPCLSVSFLCFEELEPGRGEIMVDYGAVLLLNRTVSSIHTVTHDFTLGDSKGDSEKFISKIVYLAVSAAMAMSSRPTLVEHGACLRKKKVNARTGKLDREALWEPNFLGKTYHSGIPAGGTHASPRAHWRCGHWAKQHYGPRPWTQDTPWNLLWREPILVNPD